MNVADIKINAKRKSDGATALIIACQLDATECVRALLSSAKIDINHQDQRGGTALWAACQHNNIWIMELLLNPPKVIGADPNLGTFDGSTPLSVASFNGYAMSMELLKKYGADSDKS